MVPSAQTVKLSVTSNVVPFWPVCVLCMEMLVVFLSSAVVTVAPLPLTVSLRKPMLSQLPVCRPSLSVGRRKALSRMGRLRSDVPSYW